MKCAWVYQRIPASQITAPRLFLEFVFACSVLPFLFAHFFLICSPSWPVPTEWPVADIAKGQLEWLSEINSNILFLCARHTRRRNSGHDRQTDISNPIKFTLTAANNCIISERVSNATTGERSVFNDPWFSRRYYRGDASDHFSSYALFNPPRLGCEYCNCYKLLNLLVFNGDFPGWVLRWPLIRRGPLSPLPSNTHCSQRRKRSPLHEFMGCVMVLTIYRKCVLIFNDPKETLAPISRTM